MYGRVPDAWLWLRYPCRRCGDTVHQMRGHERIAPNDPRSPLSLCFSCRDLEEQERTHCDRVAQRLLSEVFG